MKASLMILMLAVLPVFGQQTGAIAPIALYTSFQNQPAADVLEALQDEVESIMEPTGLRFDWRNLADTNGSEVSVELAVLKFKGHCDADGWFESHPKPGPLGWTHMTDGIILPFSDVDCDGVRHFLQRGLFAVRPAQRAEAYGRALGRVLAHELYHIFADTTHHGSCGVGKEAYSVQELLSDDFQFEERESHALKTSKAHVVLENTGRPAGVTK